MKKITVKNALHTLEISHITMGENGIPDGSKRAQAHKNFDRFLEAGGNCMDTARMYGMGLSERYLADYLKGRKRDEIIVTTKCAHHSKLTGKKRVTPRDIIKDAETSLKALNTDCLDILLLHRDDIKKPVGPIMDALNKLISAGKVKIIGASNWTAGRIAEANEYAEANGIQPFSVSQICYSLALSTPAISGDLTHLMMDNTEFSWYKDSGLPVMSWSPQARGFFVQYAKGGKETVKPSPMKYYGWLPENYRRAERIKKLSEELNVPIGTLVIAYLLNQPIPVTAVCSCSDDKQFEEVIGADKVALTAEQVRFLES